MGWGGGGIELMHHFTVCSSASKTKPFLNNNTL